MALNLYRRHRRDCKTDHPEEHLSSEFDERKKGWKRCECPIFASGTLAKLYRRQSTGQGEWTNAKAITSAWEAAGSWDGEAKPIPQPVPKPTHRRITVEHATKALLGELQETAAFATHKKYRLLMRRFSKFSEERGYVMIDQWEPSDIRQFRST